MTDSLDQDEFDKTSPEDAFTLLGNKTRIDIIRTLGETSDESLSFSALRDRVDVGDSGRFNYHLGKLVDSFVAQTEEGGYELTYAGRQVIGAIFSGMYNQRSVLWTFELDSLCTICGSALLAEYEHERVTINCSACDDQISSFGLPPGAFENRTHTALARAFDTWLRAHLLTASRGFCLICTGQMHGSITADFEYLDDLEVAIEHVCERCLNSTTSSVRSYLVYHPAVVAFHHDHGIDLTETPIWELPWPRDRKTTVLSREPWRVKAVIELDGDQLQCVVEDDLSISIE